MEDILLSYLDRNGILLCNREADLPCLEDIGCPMTAGSTR